MNNSDKGYFASLLTAFAELHNKKLSAHMLDIYWHALKSYELEDIKRSLNQLIVDPNVGQFMPKPADVVRCIDGDKETQAYEAWSKVMQGMRQAGAWNSVEFDDKKIHAVINDMGGWIELCRKTMNELSFLFNEFSKRYHSYQHRNIENCPSKLIGRIEKVSLPQNDMIKIETIFIGLQTNTAVQAKIENN